MTRAGPGRRIRARRRALGLTQRAVIRRMTPPMACSMLSAVERGRVTIGIESISRVAAALDTTIEALLVAPCPHADQRSEYGVASAHYCGSCYRLLAVGYRSGLWREPRS